MKADEYIEKYLTPTDESFENCIATFVSAMWVEVGDLIRARKCQRDSAIYSCYKEVEQKWKAIVRRVPAIRELLGEHADKFFSHCTKAKFPVLKVYEEENYQKRC